MSVYEQFCSVRAIQLPLQDIYNLRLLDYKDVLQSLANTVLYVVPNQHIQVMVCWW